MSNMRADTKEPERTRALLKLMAELEKAEQSAKKGGLKTLAEVEKMLGVRYDEAYTANGII